MLIKKIRYYKKYTLYIQNNYYICYMKIIKTLKISQEILDIANRDAEKLGLNFSSYVRLLIIQANQKRNGKEK